MKKNFGKILLIAGVLSVVSSSAVFADSSGPINVTTDISGQSGAYGGAVNSYDGLVTDSNGNMVMPPNRDSKLTVQDGVTFDNNTSTTGGGAVSVQNGQTAEIGNNVNFTNNESFSGGAIYTATNDVVMGDNVNFEKNTASFAGGAIYNGSSDYDTSNLTIGSNVTFKGNEAQYGGAIYNLAYHEQSKIEIGSGATFEGNKASISGGAIYNDEIKGSEIFITGNSTFKGNSAANEGGAIFNAADLSINSDAGDVLFTGNTANGKGNDIHQAGTGTTVISGNSNTVKFEGGISGEGIIEKNGNNTLEFKNADNSNFNGEYKQTGGTLTLDNSDIFKNSVISDSVINVINDSTTLNNVSNIADFANNGKISNTSLNISNSNVVSSNKLNINSSGIKSVMIDNTSYKGDIAISNGTSLSISSTDKDSSYSGTLTNDGTLTINSSTDRITSITDSTILGTGSVTNDGDLNVTGTDTTQFSGKYVQNTGTSTFTDSNLFANSELKTGTTTNLEGTSSFNENSNIIANGNINVNSDATLTNSSVIGEGTLTASKNLTLDKSTIEQNNFSSTADVTLQNESSVHSVTDTSIKGKLSLLKSKFSSDGNAELKDVEMTDNSELSAVNITADTLKAENSTITAKENITSTNTIDLKSSSISGVDITANNIVADSSTITATGTVLSATNIDAKATTINTNNLEATSVTTEESTLLINGNATVKENLTADSTNITVNGTTEITNAELNNNSTLSMNGNATFDDLKVNSGSVLQILNPDSTFEAKNGFTVAEGTVNVMNNKLTNNVIESNMTIDKRASFVVDVDPRNFKSDMFTINGDITNAGGADAPAAEITISDFNLTSVPVNRYIDLPELFKFNGNVDENIEFVDSKVQKFTPIGWYQMQQNVANDGYRLGLTAYNPQVFRGQVATVASYANQLVINNVLLDHIYLNSQTLTAKEKSNKYAAAFPQFAPYQYNKDTGSLWVKSYVNFEKLGLTQGLNVGNNSYGTIIGADFPVVDLKDGWKFLPTAFIGYNGAHQTFDKVGMYQNGGQAGFMGTFMRNEFIGSAMIYGGGYNNEMNITNTTTFGSESSYTDRTGNWFAGFAAKSAYNFHPTKHFIIQPTLLASYNLFGQQNWHTNYGDMSMKSNYLNGINVAPGVNFIYARETWSLYLTAQYVYNIMGYAAGMAGRDVDLPHVRMRHGYIEYGFGATKTIQDRLHSYIQFILRNGGRTGVGFQLGFSWLF